MTEIVNGAELYTKRGRLTRYALACGLMEVRYSVGKGCRVTLLMVGSVLRVECFRKIGRFSNSKREQFTTNKLWEARQVFDDKVKEYGLH